jgi:hypothetical protein
MVLRVALLRTWNASCCPLSRIGFARVDLPVEFINNAGARLRLTRGRPALAARAYQRKIDTLLEVVLRRPASSRPRLSRSFTERQRGALLSVAAVIGVTEPQRSGRSTDT